MNKKPKKPKKPATKKTEPKKPKKQTVFFELPSLVPSTRMRSLRTVSANSLLEKADAVGEKNLDKTS